MKLRTLLLAAGYALAAIVWAACSTADMPTAPSAPMNGVETPAPSPSPGPAPGAAATARYRITFQSTWSRSTHPTDFPSTAHLSQLVGGTHDARVSFWSEGAPASAGIRDMAERGRTSPLDQEVTAAISSGTAQRVLLGGNLSTSPGTTAFEFEISQTHPLVTLVSMVAPSPDWFVGVSGLPLFENGQWVEERRIDLVPWDAGTDSGTTFESPDRVTSPPQGVSRILTTPLSHAGRVTPLGTFTFARLPS